MVDFLYKPSSNTQPAGKPEVKPGINSPLQMSGV